MGGSGLVSESELLLHMRESLERRTGPLMLDMSELLRETVRRRYAEIHLGMHTGPKCIGQAEWIHFMMMCSTSPSHVAAKLLNKQLQMALSSDLCLLLRLQHAFEGLKQDQELDEDARREHWVQAFRDVGLFQPNKQALAAYDFLTYFEFVSHALGAKFATVQLAMYDTSVGAAKWIPSMLLGGHKFEGIWHTGVRVFGKEFWYGGGAFCQNPDQVPFGRPVRIIDLGETLRTFEELKEFLHFDLLYTFNRANYDVLHHNCNDFSNEVVGFLLHGIQIPEEVRMQPKRVENIGLTQVLKPILQQRFCCFGDAKSTLTRQCDDVTEEWRRRLQKGDMVLFRASFIERPVPVLIIAESVENRSERLMTVAFFAPCNMTMQSDVGWAALRIMRRSDVSTSQLYPCFSDLEASVMHLHIGHELDDSVRAVLSRHTSHWQAIRPVCPMGHILQERTLNVVIQPPPCNICGAHRPSVMAVDTGCALVVCSAVSNAAVFAWNRAGISMAGVSSQIC